MADYRMTNEECYEFLTKIFEETTALSPEEKELEKQIVFSALFCAFESKDENNNPTYNKEKKHIEKWDNTVDVPSEFLVGKKYILIQDSVLALVKGSIEAGLIDVLVKTAGVTTTPVLIITCAIALYEIFSNASSLDDGDFCVYYQAMTHHSKGDFSIDDLKSWLPSGTNISCNMHNSSWVCDYYKSADDSCSFCDDLKIKTALDSLEDKKLITKHKHGDIYRYSFKL